MSGKDARLRRKLEQAQNRLPQERRGAAADGVAIERVAREEQVADRGPGTGSR